MKHLSIYPWSMDSEPAERLRNAVSKRLGYKVFKVFSKKGFEPQKGQAVLDWGRSDRPDWFVPGLYWLNHPDSVRNSVDKLRSFACFEDAGVHCVPWTRDQWTAQDWLKQGIWAIARHTTKGYDGDGLILMKKQYEMLDNGHAPLYTKFIKSKREFRAYVFNGKGIDLLEKFPESAKSDPHIRTSANKWNYERDAVIPGWEKQAVKAIKSCGLDFGGVDMLWDGDQWWVLEVNTAPDIAYKTVELFADGVVDWLQAL